MKKFIKIKLCLLFGIVTFIGCTSDESKEGNPSDNEKEILEIKTLEVINVTESTAVIKANLISIGDTKAVTMGICISASPNPTNDSGTDVLIAKNGNFETNFGELVPNTTYYARAYVTNNSKTIYGNELSFITLNAVPKVTTAYIASITSTTALVGGTIENIKKLIVKSAGVCISQHSNPTIADAQKTFLLDEDYTNKKFTVNLGKLTPGTKYYTRMYVETVFGIHYAEVISFTTKEPGVPFVQTYGVYALSKNLIELTGKVLSDGGSEITKYGFCLADFDPNPTLLTNFATITTNSGVLNGAFTDRLQGIFSGYYYARVYATNKYGTGYGAVMKFTIN